MTWRSSVALPTLLSQSTPHGEAFFARDTASVAHDLIGCLLVHGECAGKIVETEAYLGERDAASHAAPGRTARNAVMFGPAGRVYVYFIYGMYHCMNFVTEQDGVAGAVLIRALEPLSGIESMRSRRPKAKRWEDLASGPGKLTLAMRIGPEHYGEVLGSGSIDVWRLAHAATIPVAVSPRIGIKKCAEWPMRFFERGNPCVSRSPFNATATLASPRG